MKLMVMPAALREKGQFESFDDFGYYTDGNNAWTKGGTGNTVGIVANTAGGILSIATDTTANHEAYVASTNAVFKFVAGRNWYCDFLAQYSEANTNLAAIALGLSSVTTGILASTTGVPNTNFSGALLYKPTGVTTWSAVTSNGTTQTLSTSNVTSQPSSSAYQCLRIEGRDVDGTNMEVTFFVNEQPLLDATFHRPIKQTLSMTSIGACKLLMYVKGTNGTNAETLLVDYVYGGQRRPIPPATS